MMHAYHKTKCPRSPPRPPRTLLKPFIRLRRSIRQSVNNQMPQASEVSSLPKPACMQMYSKPIESIFFYLFLIIRGIYYEFAVVSKVEDYEINGYSQKSIHNRKDARIHLNVLRQGLLDEREGPVLGCTSLCLRRRVGLRS